MRLPLAYPLTSGEITAALSLPKGKKEHLFPAITTRASLLMPGDLFLALKGARFDGHDFIEEALSRGAGGLIVSRPCSAKLPVFTVTDTEQALASLATRYLRMHPAKVIGITGSVGKTSAKEMISDALSLRYSVKKTEENENNLIGIAKTLLSRRKEEELLVLEIGTNSPGEILRGTSVCRPVLGILSAVGRAHLGCFKNEEALLEEKLSLLRGMSRGARLLYNGDSIQHLEHPSAVPVSLQGRAPYRAEVLSEGIEGTDFILSTPSISRRCFLPGGRHRLYSLLFALATASFFDIETDECLPLLLASTAKEGRGRPFSLGGALLLDDAYNASPESMAAALHYLSLAKGGRRIAVLGEMMELGEDAPAIHQEIGRKAGASSDVCLFFGRYAEDYRKGAEAVMAPNRISLFFDHQGVFDALLPELRRGDTLLVKASHSEKGGEIVRRLKEAFK